MPACNDAFDVLGELAQKRLGVGSLTTLFPGHDYQPLGLATTATVAAPDRPPPPVPVRSREPAPAALIGRGLARAQQNLP